MVTDSSGAIVPRAAIRLVNTQTGETYQASSNESGNYDFPLLKEGSYTLIADMPGFRQIQQTGIVLVTGVPARVDVKLQVGAATDKITVEAVAPLVQSGDSGGRSGGGEPDHRRHAADRPARCAVGQAERLHGAEHHWIERAVLHGRRPRQQRELAHGRRQQQQHSDGYFRCGVRPSHRIAPGIRMSPSPTFQPNWDARAVA